MKKLITLLAITIVSINNFAQAPDWLWAKGVGGNNNDASTSIALDANGNTYIVGYFASTSIVIGGTTLTNASNSHYDIFFLKYDFSGNLVWAKSMGGTDNDNCYSVTTDLNGNVYIAGGFLSSSITFGTITLNNSLSGLGYEDAYIAKYDSNGNAIWAKQGPASTFSQAVSVDVSGNVLISGLFSTSSVSFGSFVLTNAGSSSSDGFIVKYDSTGNILWAKSFGGTSLESINDMATDVSGGAYILGYSFSPSIVFGGDTLYSNGGSTDILTLKYDANGNEIWGTLVGGTAEERGYGIATDVNGNGVYITGSYTSSSIAFGSITLTNSSALDYDIFITKYDTSGTVQWAKSIGGLGFSDEGGSCIASDANGNIYVGGYFQANTLTFGSYTVTNSIPGGTNSEMFIVKYDSSGTALWAKSNALVAGVKCIATDANHNLAISGGYSGTISFGSTTLTNTTTGTAYGDFYVAKLTGDCFSHYNTTYDSITNVFTLTVDPNAVASATAYYWDFGDGTTSTLATPTHTYTHDTLYNVCMKIYRPTGDSCEYCHTIGIDTAGNAVRTGGFTINVINQNVTTGIKQSSEKEQAINIYPNPFTSQTTISSTKNKVQSIKVYDVMGREIRNYELGIKNEKSVTLDMSGFAKGIYFVRIEDDASVGSTGSLTTSSATRINNVVNRKIVLQ